MRNVQEPDEEAQRRQTCIRTPQLLSAGPEQCPSCGEEAERFVKRPPAPNDTKPRCLDCWKAERSSSFL